MKKILFVILLSLSVGNAAILYAGNHQDDAAELQKLKNRWKKDSYKPIKANYISLYDSIIAAEKIKAREEKKAGHEQNLTKQQKEDREAKMMGEALALLINKTVGYVWLPASEVYAPSAKAHPINMEKADTVNADTIAQELSAKYGDNPRRQVEIARAYVSNQNNVVAKSYINRALQVDGNFAPAYILQGDMFIINDKNVEQDGSLSPETGDSACCYYSRAIEVNPSYKVAYERYATAKARMKQFDAAKEMLNRLHSVILSYYPETFYADLVLKYNPDDNSAVDAALSATNPDSLTEKELYTFANKLYWCHNYETSLKFAKLGAEKFPVPNGKYFSELILWSASQSGDYKLAVEQGKLYMDNTQKDSINSIDLYSVGASEIALGNLDTGFEHLREIGKKHDYFASQTLPMVGKLIDKSVKAKTDAKDYDGALKLYTKFMEVYPYTSDPAYRLYSLANIYTLRAQNEQDSVTALTTAKEAIKYYREIEEKYQEWPHMSAVYYCHAFLTTQYLDPDNTTGMAIPYWTKLYNLIEEKAEPTASEKNQAVTAATYIAIYDYEVMNDEANALAWFKNVLKYDPENENALKALTVFSEEEAPAPAKGNGKRKGSRKK